MMAYLYAHDARLLEALPEADRALLLSRLHDFERQVGRVGRVCVALMTDTGPQVCAIAQSIASVMQVPERIARGLRVQLLAQAWRPAGQADLVMWTRQAFENFHWLHRLQDIPMAHYLPAPVTGHPLLRAGRALQETLRAVLEGLTDQCEYRAGSRLSAMPILEQRYLVEAPVSRQALAWRWSYSVEHIRHCEREQLHHVSQALRKRLVRQPVVWETTASYSLSPQPQGKGSQTTL